MKRAICLVAYKLWLQAMKHIERLLEKGLSEVLKSKGASKNFKIKACEGGKSGVY